MNHNSTAVATSKRAAIDSTEDETEYFDAREDVSNDTSSTAGVEVSAPKASHPPGVSLTSTSIDESSSDCDFTRSSKPLLGTPPSASTRPRHKGERAHDLSLPFSAAVANLSTSPSKDERETTLKAVDTSLKSDLSQPLVEAFEAAEAIPSAESRQGSSALFNDEQAAVKAVAETERTIYRGSENLTAESVAHQVSFAAKSEPLNSHTLAVLNDTLESQLDSSISVGDAAEEVVQFKNLDTGEIRLLPIDLINAVDKKKLSVKGNQESQILELFNSSSETYRKLQLRLGRIAERRIRRGQRKDRLRVEDQSQGLISLEITDEADEEDDDDDDKENSSDNSSNNEDTEQLSQLSQKGNLFQEFFSRQGSKIKSQRSSRQFEQPGSLEASLNGTDAVTATPSRMSRFSRFIRRHPGSEHQMTSRDTLPQLPIVTSPVKGSFEYSAADPSTESIYSAPLPCIDLVENGEKSVIKQQTSQLASWLLLKRHVSLNKTIPYKINTRISSSKENKCLQNVWLVREIQLSDETPIWSISVSGDGRLMAAGLQDGTIRVWGMKEIDALTTSLMRSFESVDLLAPGESKDEESFLFDEIPNLTLIGHTATIVICQWDTMPLPNGFNRLASASLDRTVRVWSIDSTADVLQQKRQASLVLHCADWSTAVCFHPVMKELLYTGSLDGTIQVWRIPLPGEPIMTIDSVIQDETAASSTINHPRLRRVEMLEYTRMTELITSMALSPNGAILAVGLRYGRVSLYDSRTLRFRAEVECKNRKGRYSYGRKVTGLVWTSDGQSICVSTSDSRLRVISLNDISNWLKFKGHVTNQMMLHANFSPSEQHLICGSETSWIYIWNLHPPSPTNTLVASRLTMGHKKKPTNSQVEKFKAFDELLTACLATPASFSSRVIENILKIDTEKNTDWRPLQLHLRQPLERKTCLGLSLHHLVIIAASFKGTIKIFVNAGHPIAHP